MSKSNNISSLSQNVFRRSKLNEENKSLKESLKRRFGLNQILGRNKVVQELHERIEMVENVSK